MASPPAPPPAEAGWLLLIHQLPPRPAYLRVKVWRRLLALGAAAVKNSVYVLPRGEAPLEDLQWVAREIRERHGEAVICEARFVEGLSDDEVRRLFHAARDAEYAPIARGARALLKGVPSGKPLDPRRRAAARAAIARLRRRLGEVAAIDFFGAPGRTSAEEALSTLEARLLAAEPKPPGGEPPRGLEHGRTWVTRKGVHIDRTASAWLIRRFIDPEARFKFVPPQGYRPEPGEIRFDMFDADFTHDGERCTFEVLRDRFRLDDPALTPLAHIVHDIDLKDERYQRPETRGVAHLVAGLALAHPEDEVRIDRAAQVFDDLHAYFARPAAATGRTRPKGDPS